MEPLRGKRPLWIRRGIFLLHKKLLTLVVRKHTTGTPISRAAVTENVIMASETMQVTGGIPCDEAALSLCRRDRKGARQLSLVDKNSDGMS